MTIHTVLANAHWIVLSLILNSALHILGKKAAYTIPAGVFHGEYSFIATVEILIFNPYLIITGFALLAGFLAWIRVLAHVPVSVAVPILSLNYIVICLIGYIFFNEPMTILKISGIILIMMGVLCVVYS